MFLCYTVMTAILTSIATVQCLPIWRMDNSSSYVLDSAQTDQPVIMSKEPRMQLTNKLVNSSGLFSLWLNANVLTKPNILKAKVRSISTHFAYMCIYICSCVAIQFIITQYQRWERTEDSCKDNDNTTLTYSQLINYYNELVIQLRLAQYNLNVSIALEVKEEKLSYALKREEQIIKLLNESILPALETTVSSH